MYASAAQLLGQVADVVANQKGNLDCDLKVLELVLDRTTQQQQLDYLRALLVVATFLGVLAARFYAADRRDDRRRDDVAEVAARLALSFVTYDYRDLDSSIQRVRRDATDGFFREYERFMQNEGGSLLERTQAQSKATVDDVFLGDIGDGSASAFVVLTVTRQGLGAQAPAAGAYLRLQLTQVDGKWLVEKVNPLFTDAATGAAVQPPQAPAPSTTTVAP